MGGQSRSSSLPRSVVKTLVAGVRNFQVAQSVRGRVRACACASESVCTRPVRQSRSARVRTHVCVGVFMCACVSACVRVPVLACVFARACARARVRVCACDRFSVCVSVCVCTCVSALWLPPGVVAIVVIVASARAAASCSVVSLPRTARTTNHRVAVACRWRVRRIGKRNAT